MEKDYGWIWVVFFAITMSFWVSVVAYNIGKTKGVEQYKEMVIREQCLYDYNDRVISDVSMECLKYFQK
jgi:hypothetical protein